MHDSQDARQSIIHAYVRKALNAEEKRREACAAGRSEATSLWHKAATYAWSMAEFGNVTTTDAVNGEYDRRILDKRFLANVTGDEESINDGEWCEKHELILGGVLHELTLAEVRIGVAHFVAGLTAEVVGHELGFYTPGVVEVLESMRFKGRNLIRGESATPPRYHLSSRGSHKANGIRNKHIQPLVSALLQGPMTTEKVAGLLGGTLKTARRLLKVLETNGYTWCAGKVWQLTDKGQRFAEESTVAVAVDHDREQPNVTAVDVVNVVEVPVVVVAAVESTSEGKGEEIVPTSNQRPNHADKVIAALVKGPMDTTDVQKLLGIHRNLCNTVMSRLYKRDLIVKHVDGRNISWALPEGGAAQSPGSTPAPSPAKKRSTSKSRKAKKVRVSVFARLRRFTVRVFDGCLRLIGLQRIGGSAE